MQREYRPLGKTGLMVSAAGLGTEYLEDQSAETVRATIAKARECGVNYADILFSFREYREHLAQAIAPEREEWVLAVHLGCAETNGQFRSTRDLTEIRASFEDFLQIFRTDHADLLILQMVDTMEDFAAVMAPGGMYDLAQSYVKAGQAKGIGLSSHVDTVALAAVRSGKFDAVMYPFSSGGRKAEPELIPACRAMGVSFIAMKPFLGGRLVKRNTEGMRLMEPAECIGFVLSTPGVTTCVPGASCPGHMEENARHIPGFDLPALRDLTAVTRKIKELGQGECIYCGHCEPCSAGIRIAQIVSIVDSCQWEEPANYAEAYAAQRVQAEQCIECGQCLERCPYGVPIIEKMHRAVELFKK